MCIFIFYLILIDQSKKNEKYVKFYPDKIEY